MTSGEIIRETRRAAGLTQSELAELLGVTSAMISNYERNMRKPKPATMLRIWHALEEYLEDLPDTIFFSYAELFGISDNMAEGFYIVMDSEIEKALVKSFRALSPAGQQVALERLEELAQLPKYQKSPSDAQEAPLPSEGENYPRKQQKPRIGAIEAKGR